MKALGFSEFGKLEYLAMEKPELQKGEAIIRIKRVGISGTDLHTVEGTEPFFTYPRIRGHGFAGELVDFDVAPGFTNGDYVTIVPYFNCRRCIACLRGKPNCCANMNVSGVHVDGGMAEYLSVPVSSLVHGQGLSLDELALLEPLAIGAHSVRRAWVEEDEFVLVIGTCSIGLAAMEFVQIAGAKVIALDNDEQRLQYCREKLHVDFTINPSMWDVMYDLKQITKGDLPTVIIDATGRFEVIKNAFQYLAYSGRYVMIGQQNQNISFNHSQFHKREATLLSSRNATRMDFDLAISSIKCGKIRPEVYISHRVRFDELNEAFNKWLNPESGVIKVMVEFN